MKKKYFKPEMTVIKMRSRACLLQGSDPDRFYNRKAKDEYGEDADQL